MTAASRAIWRRLVRDYGATGVMTGVDTDALRVYCEAVARYEAASVLLEVTGPLVKGARGNEMVANPLHRIVRDDADLIRAYAREFGFTPSARSAIVAPKKAGAEDPLEKWMAK